MSTEPRRQTRRRERRPQQIRGRKEGGVGAVETGDEEVVPQGVEVGAALVEDFGKVGVHVFGGEAVARRGVGFFDREGLEEAVEVLHVGDVAAEADYGGWGAGGGEGAEALDVCEAREGAVGCWRGVSWGVVGIGGRRTVEWTDQGCQRR